MVQRARRVRRVQRVRRVPRAQRVQRVRQVRRPYSRPQSGVALRYAMSPFNTFSAFLAAWSPRSSSVSVR